MDVIFENHGSIFLCHPLTEAAHAWIDEHIPEDAQFFGGALVIEHRYVNDIVSGMAADGLDVE